MTSFSDSITAFTHTLDLDDVPTSATSILKLSVLDWVSVAIAGQTEPVAEKVRALILNEGGSAGSSLFGSRSKVPPRAAALSNGTTSHALDYDDTHFLHIGHPSVAVFPAVLALAENKNASGAEFLTAALAGYEASCRIGHWFGRSHYEAGFHQTATAGAFGAVLGSARILDLSYEQTGHAFGLATTRVSGLKSQFGTMGKPFNAGLAASNGVEAALLAQGGFVSNPSAFERPQGFAETHATEQQSEAVNNLGKDFVLETVQHKFHACCHGLHAMLEALTDIRDEQNLAPDQILAVKIATHPRWLAVCNKPDPETGLEAKFSYRQTAAMCLNRISTGSLSSYTSETCDSPAIRVLREKVRVSADDALADTATRIVVETDKGLFERHFDLNTVLPYEIREQKVRAKSKDLLGGEKSDEVWEAVQSLDSLDDIRSLTRCWTN